MNKQVIPAFIRVALVRAMRAKAKLYCRSVEQTPLIKFYYSVCEPSTSRMKAKKQNNKKNSLMFWFFLTGSLLIDVSVPGKADSLIVLYSLSLSTNTMAWILWKLQKRELKMCWRVGHLFACYFGKNWPPPRIIIYNEYNFIKWINIISCNLRQQVFLWSISATLFIHRELDNRLTFRVTKLQYTSCYLLQKIFLEKSSSVCYNCNLICLFLLYSCI